MFNFYLVNMSHSSLSRTVSDNDGLFDVMAQPQGDKFYQFTSFWEYNADHNTGRSLAFANFCFR